MNFLIFLHLYLFVNEKHITFALKETYMQDIWKNFVYNLIEAKRQNVDEESYHKLVENQLQLLGWAPYLGEICHKQNIPIGNSGHIQPDILIKRGNDVQFVIEVKRPVHVFTSKEHKQLESYMRQLKLEVGLYIGDHIEVIYDKPNSNKDSISVFSLSLSLEEKRGEEFTDLFSKDNFSRDLAVKFCEDRLIQMKRQATLNKIKEDILNDPNGQIASSLSATLTEKYADSFTRDEIKAMLHTLTFSVNSKYVDVATNKPANGDDSAKRQGKQAHDNTVYSINGGEFVGKGRFVYNVVADYVKHHPNSTFSELEKVFAPGLQGSFGVIRTMDYIHNKNFQGGRRYYAKPSEILQSGDQVQFAVSSEWGANNISRMENLAEKLGYQVAKSPKTPTKHASSKKAPAVKNELMIKCHISRHSDANGLFNPKDQSLIVLKGSKINPSNISSITACSLKRREKLINDYAGMVNGEMIVNEDIRFDSPSGAAVFCVGGETNGWTNWKDGNGNKLEVYR